jgi:hypothetical protein
MINPLRIKNRRKTSKRSLSLVADLPARPRQ